MRIGIVTVLINYGRLTISLPWSLYKNTSCCFVIRGTKKLSWFKVFPCTDNVCHHVGIDFLNVSLVKDFLLATVGRDGCDIGDKIGEDVGSMEVCKVWLIMGLFMGA